MQVDEIAALVSGARASELISNDLEQHKILSWNLQAISYEFRKMVCVEGEIVKVALK